MYEAGKSGAKELYSDFVEPFVKDAEYMWDDTVKGGMWTRSIEESYEKGSNQGKRDLVIAELLLSRGAASAYKQGVKKAIDLPDGDGQRGKRDGGNRAGLLLDGVDNNRNSSASLKGGKLKTQAKSFPKSIEELQEMVDKLLKQMGNVLGGVAVFRDAYSGEYRFYFVRHDDLSGNGGGGGGNHRRSDNGNEGKGKSDLDIIRKDAPDYYQELMDKYGDKGTYHARTPDEYEDLARDPDHNFNIDDKTRIERQAGLELEVRGELTGPIVRDPVTGRGEFIDGNGQVWDVKGFNSNYPPKKGGFRLDKAMADIEDELSKGENVILDTTKLSQDHIEQLTNAISTMEWKGKIRWWP
ncbi:hypothetical protein [Brevibacillus sp. FIR094]|uniref:hypothetical protein n=1 Tax=Brevibacillus sp. FIR094 TaxID=3134809 RepID=UPI003D1FA8B7